MIHAIVAGVYAKKYAIVADISPIMTDARAAAAGAMIALSVDCLIKNPIMMAPMLAPIARIVSNADIIEAVLLIAIPALFIVIPNPDNNADVPADCIPER